MSALSNDDFPDDCAPTTTNFGGRNGAESLLASAARALDTADDIESNSARSVSVATAPDSVVRGGAAASEDASDASAAFAYCRIRVVAICALAPTAMQKRPSSYARDRFWIAEGLFLASISYFE